MFSFRQNLQPDLAIGVIGEDRDSRVSSLAMEHLPFGLMVRRVNRLIGSLAWHVI